MEDGFSGGLGGDIYGTRATWQRNWGIRNEEDQRGGGEGSM